MSEGLYTIYNVPESHPIAFHNVLTDGVEYGGQYFAGKQIAPDGFSYDYYYGDVSVFISSPFDTLSYSCKYHGYMGGENSIAYSALCRSENNINYSGEPIECISNETDLGIVGGNYIFLNTYFAQELVDCSSDDISASDLLEQQRGNSDINTFMKSTSFRNSEQNQQQFYIPVVINLLTTNNNRPHSTASGYDILSEEHAEYVLESLNQAFNETQGWVDRYENDPQIDYQVGNSGINFIKGDKGVDGNEIDWVRIFNMEEIEDDLPTYYNTCDSSDYSLYHEFIGQEGYVYPMIKNSTAELWGYPNVMYTTGCLSMKDRAHYILSEVGYYPSEYLNINVIVSGYGSILGWAAYPTSANPHVCFIRGTGYSSADAVLPHEIGHFFGLKHSFGDGSPVEPISKCDDALNELLTSGACENTGDYVCDTYPTKADFDHCYDTFVPGVDTLFDKHCNIHVELLPDYSKGRTPVFHSNMMDYSLGTCDQAGFTEGQNERMRAHIISTSRNDYHVRGLQVVDLAPNEACGDTTACNYYEGGINQDLCLYLDALGDCGGDCEEDIDSDGICDDVDDCFVDLNNNGVCDDVDPCVGYGSDSPLYGLFDDPGVSSAVKAIGNRCWALTNVHRVTFQNGDEIPTVTIGDIEAMKSEYMSLNAEESPVRVNVKDFYNPLETDNHFAFESMPYFTEAYQYNWYAVDDPRGLCPSGWHVPTDADWKNFEKTVGYKENELVRWSRSYNPSAVSSISNRGFINNIIQAGSPVPFFYSIANGALNNRGKPVFVGSEAFFWSSDEYTKRYEDNAIFRGFAPTLAFSKPTSPWSQFDVGPNPLPGFKRYYQLGSTSGSKHTSMSVRCVKDK